jgi:hypothetical protein
MKARVTAALFAALVVGSPAVQPEPWLHPDGSVHYYDATLRPDGTSWFSAYDSAVTLGGYLATLTSSAENDFVFALVDTDGFWYERPGSGLWAGPWLGGYQPAGSREPASGWTWINGEPFGPSNWTAGRPDNNGNENCLHFGESAHVRFATWDDADGNDVAMRGFVAEFSASQTTMGLTLPDIGAEAGYVLFGPNQSRITYLIDNAGRLVRSWTSSYVPGQSVYLLESGDLLRTANVHNPDFNTGGSGGRVERFDWDGNLVWDHDYSSTQHCQHHDIEPLPNGNVVLVAWELKSRAEAIAAGRNPALLTDNELWPDHLVEVDPLTDSIVWEWHLWDHLVQDYDSTQANWGVVANHPELVDLNYIRSGNPGADWIHSNAVDYNPGFDQLVVSAHDLNEIWVIDHSTTTDEARGHTGGRSGMGGDILYRWGNPQAYRAGTSADRKFFGQHDAQWIEPGLPGAGHILVFNNGSGRPSGRYSTVDELIPDCDSNGAYARPAPGAAFGPSAQCWVYAATPPTSLFSPAISGAQRLPNGNTIICEGDSGHFFEVASDTSVVWGYIDPVVSTGPLNQGDSIPAGRNSAFRVRRYLADYPGLAGRDLTPGYPIERYVSPPLGIAAASERLRHAATTLAALPNPARGRVSLRYEMRHGGRVSLAVYNLAGEKVRGLIDAAQPTGAHSAVWDGRTDDGRSAGPGVYVFRLETAHGSASRKLLLAE